MIPTESPLLPTQAPQWGSWQKWLNSPPGKYILDWEQECFNRIVSNLFGFHALQIGLPQLNTLSENRMPLQAVLINPHDTKPFKNDATWHVLEGLPGELPFANESIDLLVLPHILEFSADPHQVLREAERVLVPEGRLVISGFNPASLWGIKQFLSSLIGNPYLPPEGQLISLIRLKDWLKLLNFSLDRGHFGCYKPPLRSESGMTRMNYLEPMGNRWWPIFGAVFLVSAVKRQEGVRLVGRIPEIRVPSLKQLNPVTERNKLKSK